MTITESTALIKKNLPAQIADNLSLCGLTKTDLIDEIESSDNSIHLWQHLVYLPSLPAALAMAKTFGITLDRLCTGED